MSIPIHLCRIRQARTTPDGRGRSPKKARASCVFALVSNFLLAFVAIQPGLASAQTLNEEAKLFPTPTAGAGTSVSISNDTAVVGAPGDNSDKGAAYVFVRDSLSGAWTPQQTLLASDGAAGDRFGASVSISGNNIAIGAAGRDSDTGAVYTFNRSGTTWTQATTLTDESASMLGYSVSIQGLTLVAGAPYTTIGAKVNVGNAYAFTSLDGGLTWQQQFPLQVVTGQARSGDHLGWSVALSGNTALVGAPDDDFGNKQEAGSMYVFVRHGAVWSLQTRINPGPVRSARVGAGVALFADTAVIGSDGSDNATGKAYVYARSGTSWTRVATLTAADGAAGDRFGAGVAVSGQLAVIGAPFANATGAQSGKAYLFGMVGGVFQQLAMLAPSDNAAGDNFGASAALDAGRALMGAPALSSGNGAGYVFLVAPPTITTITNIAPEPSVVGQSYAVSIQVTTDPIGLGTPTGSVTMSDGVGSTCIAVLDAAGTGTCNLGSSAAGTLTISASYSGASTFGASSGTATHTVTFADSTTTITQDFPDPSTSGQTVTVAVAVAAVAPGAGTPSGPVTITDDLDNTVTCTIADISVSNSCTLSFNTLGTSNLTATYGGDAGFNGSVSTAELHTVISPSGDHLVFVPQQPADVLQGTRLNGVTIQVQDAGNALVPINGTEVTLSVGACGGTVLFGPVVTVNGVADFSGIGPNFYTMAVNVVLDATSDAGDAPASSDPFNVIGPNPDLVFTDGFDSCRL
jgi:hypothetical protein